MLACSRRARSTLSLGIFVFNMQLPPELANEIARRFERAKANGGSLSTDRTAVLVDGSIGYGCYISPDGDLFMETYDIGSDEPPTVDRSYGAQIQVLLLGSRSLPQLAELIPQRPLAANDCSACNGTGRTHLELSRLFGSDGFLCQVCFGLGWIRPSP